MTKMKSRKMTKSTFAIIIMGIAMVAMLAFGGTFAYFTATAAQVQSVATTGKIALGANSIGTLTANVVSGENVLGSGQKVTVENQSNREAYIFVEFTVEFLDSNGNAFTENTTNAYVAGQVRNRLAALQNDDDTQEEIESRLEFEGDYILKYAAATGWNDLTGVRYTATGNAAVTGVLVYDAATAANPAAGETIDVCTSIYFYGKSESAQAMTTGENPTSQVTVGTLMNAQIRLTIRSKAIQKAGFADAAHAYVALVGDTVEVTPAQG